MKKILLVALLLATFTVRADERGERRLERISRHYSALGNYSLNFVLRAGEGEQKGELAVEGNNSYMRVGDTEVFIADSLRYEVRPASKEIVIDKAELYERELMNPLNGFASVKADYNIEEVQVEGKVAVRLTPKHTGDTIYIITETDGESIQSILYGVGGASAEVVVEKTRKSHESLPRFDKERYKGFELIDFR